MRTFSRVLIASVALPMAVFLQGCGSKNDNGNQSGQTQVEKAAELVVYSARKEHLIKPLFDRYSQQTGVKINYITDNAGPLLARLQAEGASSPADILLTVDAGNLWQAAESGLLRQTESKVLREQVPANLRDSGGHWYGLSVRARTIIYSTERVEPSELSTYENLAMAEWNGRLCLRTSKKVYNQSLVATMIAELGELITEDVVKGWVRNLAADPYSNDTKVAEAIAAGQCDVGIVNTYYLARLQAEDPEYPVAVFWPNQDGRGVHVNVSGAGITKASKQPEAALALIEWLVSPTAQGDFAAVNQEYPVNEQIPVSPLLESWGTFKRDALPVSEAGRLQADAVRLMDRAGYR